MVTLVSDNRQTPNFKLFYGPLAFAIGAFVVFMITFIYSSVSNSNIFLFLASFVTMIILTLMLCMADIRRIQQLKKQDEMQVNRTSVGGGVLHLQSLDTCPETHTQGNKDNGDMTCECNEDIIVTKDGDEFRLECDDIMLPESFRFDGISQTDVVGMCEYIKTNNIPYTSFSNTFCPPS